MKKLNLNSFIYIFLLIALGSIIWVTITPPTITNLPKKVGNKPDFSFDKVTIHFINNGLTEMSLNASTALFYKNQDHAIAKNVTVTLYSDKKISSVIKSPITQIYPDQQRLNMKNARTTLLLKPHPLNISTDTLEWLGSKSLITGQGNIHLTTHKLDIKGNRLTVDLTNKKIRIKQGAIASINPK